MSSVHASVLLFVFLVFLELKLSDVPQPLLFPACVFHSVVFLLLPPPVCVSHPVVFLLILFLVFVLLFVVFLLLLVSAAAAFGKLPSSDWHPCLPVNYELPRLVQTVHCFHC